MGLSNKEKGPSILGPWLKGKGAFGQPVEVVGAPKAKDEGKQESAKDSSVVEKSGPESNA